MSRPLRETAVAIIGIVVLVLGVRYGLKINPRLPQLAVTLVGFAAGVNARVQASLPVRLLDGAAVLAGIYLLVLIALPGGFAGLPVALLALVIAVASAALLHTRESVDPSLS